MDVWGSRIKHLVWKVLQKPAFRICRDYVDFGVIFTWFSMALGPILMTFGVLETGLKFTRFWGLLWGTPKSWSQARSVVIWLLSGPYSNSQTASRSYSTCKIHHETCRNEGIRKSRMQITKIRKIKAVTCSHYNRKQEKDRGNPSQPGGPSSRGRRITKFQFHGF